MLHDKRGVLEIVRCDCPIWGPGNRCPCAPVGPLSHGRCILPNSPQSTCVVRVHRACEKDHNQFIKLTHTDNWRYQRRTTLCCYSVMSFFSHYNTATASSNPLVTAHRGVETAQLRERCRGETSNKVWKKQQRTWFCFATMQHVRISPFTAQLSTPINWAS